MLRFLAPGDTPGADAPPRFRPGANVHAYRAHYGAVRTARWALQRIERLGKDYRSNQNGGCVGTPTQQRHATAHNLRDTGGADIGTRAFAPHGARATTR